MSTHAVTLDPRRISRLALFVHKSKALPLLLLLPCMAWIFVFFIVPLMLMIGRSFVQDGFSLAIYGDLATSPQYIKVMLNSLKIVALTTIATLILGYPVAYVLTMSGGWTRIAMLTLVTIPDWVRVIVSRLSWVI